jgi:lipopolysaccharide export system protein LptC
VTPRKPRRAAPPKPGLRESVLRGERTLAIAAALAIMAALLQWILWLQRDPDLGDAFVGPPRSDYTLSDFTLTAMKKDGSLGFRIDAPRMAKHPFLGTFAIDTPKIRLRDGRGNEWLAHSATGWVSDDARTVRLEGDVVADRPRTDKVDPMTLNTERLVAKIEDNRLQSDLAVTLRTPGSILRGVGLDAELKVDRVRLLSQFTARHDAKARR